MTVPQRTTPLDAAHHYARRGFEVFPANPRTKAPLTDNGMKDATTNEDQIERWWTQHPDALVACRIPIDQVVLDIDPRHNGDKTWAELERSYALIMSARVHTSGRGDGGAHHWFKRPDGKLSARKLHDWAKANGVGQEVGNGKWTSGIDILHHDHRYSILPPSPHPATGKPYLWTHRDEPAQMPSFLAALITAEPVTVTATPNPTTTTPSIVDSIADWYNANSTWRQLLEPAGWTIVAGDGESDGSKWKHPNATAASSASIRHGCLFVYTPNTHFPETEQGDAHGVTRFRAFTTLTHAGDGTAAARDAYQMRDGPRPPQASLSELVAPTTPPPATLNLPDEFWTARPVLQKIRQAAHAKLVSADALLVCVLARVSMMTPPNMTLPPIIGGDVSLNLFVAIVDPSGGGKSASVSVARQLVPHQRTDVVDPILPSSGEGLIEAYFDWVEEEQADGKKRKVKKQVKTAGLAFVDEGQALLAQSDRSGSTIMPTLRSAWMGGDLGQHNASEERKRWLQAHRYRLSLIMGFQLAYAASVISDSEGGTPQRFTFALATDPNIDPDATFPEPIQFTPPPTTPILGNITIDPDVIAGIKQRRLGRSRGELVVDPLDTHQDLRREKLAMPLALLDGRTHITADDWELACQIDAMSCRVRTYAIETDRAAQTHARRAAIAHAVEREASIETASIERKVRRIARNVARKVWRENTVMTPAEAGRTLSSRDRDIDLSEAITVAVAERWLVESAPGQLERGAVEP